MSRNATFVDGAHGGDLTGIGTEPATSLQQNVDPMYHPDSILGYSAPSGDGYSDADKQRMLMGGGMLASDNGESASTYKKSKPIETTQAGVMNV